MVTVFTPTYNRAHLLDKLYSSLLTQSIKDFEWLIVDDGSTDQTEIVVEKFIKDETLNITYYKQKNGGKHRAINKGVELARGWLFFIVDSDDYLADNAIEFIINNMQDIGRFAGLSGRRANFEGITIGSSNFSVPIEASAIDFRFRYKIIGDMAEVFKTSVLREYSFPEFEGELFCPEALVWNRISRTYDMLWFPNIIYYCEYIVGGLTDSIFEVRRKSPMSAILYYSELMKMPIPCTQKIKANINYWRFSKYTRLGFTEKWLKANSVYSFIGLPLSLFFIIKDKL